MSKVTALAIAGIVSLVSAIPAGAADPPRKYRPPPAQYVAPEIYDPVTNGWYLRGDIGLRLHTLNSANAGAGLVQPTDNDLNGGFAAGIGVGFKQNWLRVDFTTDFASRTKYTGTFVTAGDVSAKVQAHTSLINFYYEPYVIGRFTPYVGAGVGAAHVSISNFASATVPPFTSASTHEWRFAYALMAGSSYAISRNLHIDAGYRYLNVGNAETAADLLGRTFLLRSIAAHEVRLGARFMFPEPSYAR